MPERIACGSRRVEIFAVACSGCIGLSQDIGVPLVCLRASSDPAATVAEMNAQSHASAALWLNAFQPFEIQPGWSDWRLFPFDAVDAVTIAPGYLDMEDGRLGFRLPGSISTACFEAKLFSALGCLRLEAFVTSPQYLLARRDGDAAPPVRPRYTLVDPRNFRAGVAKVDNLFVLDPTQHAELVVTLARSARRAAIREIGETHHHVF